ncbi:MAG TPA: hypothetical protein VK708_14575 [Bryobacteraceae bacterium]|jgi:phosphoribosylformylglycinamidine (FGAM) synthase-like amidotransferase family enzyme|nr:hypothetical protein [Bryobacteraceae bacterium]
MNGKSLLMVGALALASLGIASAKTYDIILEHPANAGTNQLKAGEYKVKVEGSQAVFTDARNGKSSISVPVKIENGDKKFGDTTLETDDQTGVSNIREIDLGGSNTRLMLGQ